MKILGTEVREAIKPQLMTDLVYGYKISPLESQTLLFSDASTEFIK